MSYPNKQEITLYDAVTPIAVTSSTDATPIVVTATSHGFSVGDRVMLFGHTTNLAANGTYKVKAATTNTITLGDELTNADIAGSGGGAGSSGMVVKAPPVLFVQDFRNIILQVSTSGSATLNFKIAGSLGKPNAQSLTSPRYDLPNFCGTVSPANPYTYLQVINLDTAAAVNGATGLAVTGTDINNEYEVNVNTLKYLTVTPNTFTQGAITVKAILVSNA